MDKKRSFHHKKDDDDEPKKAAIHPKVEEVEEEAENMSASAKKVEDPLDNEDVKEETVAPEDEVGEVETPAPPAPKQPVQGGPKINFDYPQSSSQATAFNQIPKPVGGSNLDDLANQDQEEYDQPNQPVAPGGPAPRPVNPYAQQPAQQSQDFGIKSVRQPQPDPTFPGGQNMNGNVRPPGQFGPGGPSTPGNFNFRREGNYRSGGGSNKVYFIVLLVIGLIVLGGAVYLLKNQLRPTGPKSSPTPEVTISTPAPSPTPEVLDRSKFTIRVLNGSGKTGLAGTVSDKLKSLGYKIEKTDNATNSAFLQTLVRTKNDQKLSDQLIKDLSDQSYSAASSSALPKADTSEAEVILGAK